MKYLLCVAVLAGFIGSNSFAADFPHYTVKKATGKIIIDGNIDEADWAAAPSFGDFAFPAYESGEKEQTEAKMLWDDEFLYVYFKCQDKNIAAKMFNTNSATFNDDCVELFWIPNPADTLFYQFEISCVGVATSKLNDKPKRKITYLMPPHIAQTFQGTVNNDADVDTGWTMEWAIRFSDYPALKDFYGTPKPITAKAGDTWRISLNRCGGVVNPQYSQWSPTIYGVPGGYANFTFHAPLNFGYLHFSADKVK